MLPPEIIDIIVGALPYEPLLWSLEPLPSHEDAHKKEEQDIRTCTYVSRSFSIAARRRLFSTLTIPSSQDKQGNVSERINILSELLENDDFIECIRTVRIKVDSSDGLWHSRVFMMVDELIERILTVLDTSATQFCCLYLEGPIRSKLGWCMGPLAQGALLRILPRLQDLRIRSLAAPASIFENSPLLKTLCLIHTSIGSDEEESGSEPPSGLPSQHDQSLPSQLDELVLRFKLGNFYELYHTHGQNLPTCKRIRVEYRRNEISWVRELLEENRRNLESLEIVRQFNYQDAITITDAVLGLRMELQSFQRLTTLRFLLDGTKNSQLEGLLHFVNMTFSSIISFLKASGTPPSLRHLDLFLPYIGDIYMFQELKTILTLSQRPAIQAFTPFEIPPSLEAINVVIDFPGMFYGHESGSDADNKNKVDVHLRLLLRSLFGIDEGNSSPLAGMLHIQTSRNLSSRMNLYRAERFATQ